MADSSTHAPLSELIGRQLSSVEFVQDYLQLRFDGPTLNVYNPIHVEAQGLRSKAWDPEFRNMLCEQIAKSVRSVGCRENEALVIEFIDGAAVHVSLLPDEYCGAEAVYYHGFQDGSWGVI